MANPIKPAAYKPAIGERVRWTERRWIEISTENPKRVWDFYTGTVVPDTKKKCSPNQLGVKLESTPKTKNGKDSYICVDDFKPGLARPTSPPHDAPTLQFYSADWCPMCSAFETVFQYYQGQGYCPRLQIKKINIDDKQHPIRRKDLPPDFPAKLVLPFFALQHSDGSWQSFVQWPSGPFHITTDYFFYLVDHIDACKFN